MEDVIRDCISGGLIVDTPLTRRVQHLAQWLLSLGYHPEQILISPSFQIVSPKGEMITQDLALFRDIPRLGGNVLLVANCGDDFSSSGLKDALAWSGAHVGIWFNGRDLTYLVHVPEVFQSIGVRAVGSLLRQRRELLVASDPKYSLRQVSSRCGVQPSHLSRVELGSATASDELLTRLAEDLQLDRSEVFSSAGRLPPDIQEALLLQPRLLRALSESLQSDPQRVLDLLAARPVRDGKW